MMTDRSSSLHNCPLSDLPTYLPPGQFSEANRHLSPVLDCHLRGSAVGVRSVGTGESELRKGAVSR